MNIKRLLSLTVLAALATQPAHAVTKQQKQIAAAISAGSLVLATGYWIYSKCSAPVLCEIDDLPKTMSSCILITTINKLEKIVKQPHYYSDNFPAVDQETSSKTIELDKLFNDFYTAYGKDKNLTEVEMLTLLHGKATALQKNNKITDEIQLQISIARQL